MSTHLRATLVLGGFCCAVGLSLGAWAAPDAAVPPPPDVGSLPPLLPRTTTADAPRPVVLPEAQAGQDPRGEPAVQKSVVEDAGTRIDELKVRGRTKRITVTPKKGGLPAYEIIPSSGGLDRVEGPAGSSGAVGQRVWPVLSF